MRKPTGANIFFVINFTTAIAKKSTALTMHFEKRSGENRNISNRFSEIRWETSRVRNYTISLPAC